MLIGAGRHRLSGNSFSKRPNLGAPDQIRVASTGRSEEVAYGMQSGGWHNVSDTQLSSFAKPTSVALNTGLVPNDPHLQVILAREMYDYDPIAGAVVDTLVKIPFGAFSLSGLPSKDFAKPYEVSLDRVRSKSLLPLLAASHLVDGAFLGGGLFDDGDNVWNSVIPYDVLHSTIIPAPFFGSTPIVDIELQQDALRAMRSTDDRMKRYRKYLPEKFFSGGVLRLQPENTFYIPNQTLSHVPLGVSLYRKIMIIYLLEKALMRGTIEKAYRRQSPILHLTAGDENWDASIEEMNYLSGVFRNADLDPLSAVVVTRPGVTPNEVGGSESTWKWTDSADILSSMKLKGLGMPDGLLGGDVALDSVSATLTVFVNSNRQFRDLITRLFFYEKFFPPIAITNNQRKDHFSNFEGSMDTRGFYSSYGSDMEIDMNNYFTPMISWHSSLRPEGDREYMEMLETLRQAGVPIPIRVMTAAGGLDIHDILNSAPDDLANRAKIAEINAKIAAMDQASGGMGGDGQDGGDQQGGQQGGYEQSAEQMYRDLAPFKQKGIMDRDYGDLYKSKVEINGHKYYTTPRESRRMEERMNRLTSIAAAEIARKINREKPKPVAPRNHSLIRRR